MDQLFIDCCGYASLVLNESANGSLRFQSKFQEANRPNKNGRIYTKKGLSSNVDKLMEQIENRGLIGELDHAADSIVHLANVSHVITKLWWDNDNLMGEGEILNSPNGKVLRSLIESGIRVGMSSRGVGSGKQNNEGILVIDENFKLITFDAVADPSTYEAYPKKISVKKENVFDDRDLQESNKNKVNPKALISYFGQVLQESLKK